MGGGEKTTQQGSQTQTYAQSPAEQEQTARLNRIGGATEQEQIGVNKAALGDVTSLLLGQNLPGYLQKLPYGISPDVIDSIVKYSLRDMNSQLANSGVGSYMESGAAQQAGVRASADVRNQAEQFNLGNLMQLLNIGVGGQASTQTPMLGYSSQLSGLLKGTGTTSGNFSGSTIGMNPFLKSFQQSAGTSLGKGQWGGSQFFG